MMIRLGCPCQKLLQFQHGLTTDAWENCAFSYAKAHRYICNIQIQIPNTIIQIPTLIIEYQYKYAILEI